MKHILLASLLAISFPVWSGIGQVSDHKGSGCEIVRNKSKIAGNKGAEIESMDTYVTGSCSANITFKDDTKVKVTENSKLLIDDFVFDPKKSDAGKLTIKAAMGTVRYTSGQIAKNNPQAVDVKTPTASIAVRGTDFTMTVDETGESLVVLVPSCKHESEQKKYELDEQRCKVGKITVTTLAGSVELDQAFEATYITSVSKAPTPPVVVNTTEGKIGNNLIIIKPQEVQKSLKDSKKNKKDQEQENLESDALSVQAKQESQQIQKAEFIEAAEVKDDVKCDSSKKVCVKWERPDQPDIQSKGKGVAFRNTPNEHYAEVKTTGYSSNTSVTIIQNDVSSTEVLGDGSPGGNIVTIKQNAGVLKR